MIELNSKIKNALIKIGFIERYEELSNKFNDKRTPSSNRLAYIDSEEVMETIQDLGYSPVFDVKEKFYKIKEEQIGKITLEVHIILRYGMVDLVWIVRENGELLLGAPWGTYSRRLIDNNYRIKKPIIGTSSGECLLHYYTHKKIHTGADRPDPSGCPGHRCSSHRSRLP